MATIQVSIADLRSQAGQGSQDTASLLQITNKGQKDAMIVKVLAQMATMYLPASLVAVSIELSHSWLGS